MYLTVLSQHRLDNIGECSPFIAIVFIGRKEHVLAEAEDISGSDVHIMFVQYVYWCGLLIFSMFRFLSATYYVVIHWSAYYASLLSTCYIYPVALH